MEMFVSGGFWAAFLLVNTDPIRHLSQSSAAPLGVTHPPETLVSLSLWSRADRPAAAGLPRCFSMTKCVALPNELTETLQLQNFSLKHLQEKHKHRSQSVPDFVRLCK